MSSHVTKRSPNLSPIMLQYCNQFSYTGARISRHIHIILTQTAIVLLFFWVTLILTQYIFILKSSFRNFQDLSFIFYLWSSIYFLEERRDKRGKDHSSFLVIIIFPVLPEADLPEANNSRASYSLTNFFGFSLYQRSQTSVSSTSWVYNLLLSLTKEPGFAFLNLGVDKKCLCMTQCPAYTHHSRQATNCLESSDNNNAHQNQFIWL